MPVGGHDGEVSFFDDTAQPDDDEPDYVVPEWDGPPQGVLGGVAPLSGQVLGTGNVFAGLRAVTAYRTGLALSVVLAAWRGDLPGQRWQALEAAVSGGDHDLAVAAPSAGGPRWAVELADGHQVSTADPSRRGPDGAPKGAVLVETGSTGSGGAREVDRQVDLWLWPLPQGEAISLVLHWPDLEVPAATYRLDLDPVRAAVQRAVSFQP